MANIRIKDLSTTATSTASDDFLGIDGTTNGTRKMAAQTPVFNSVTGNATTDLTLAGGSSGASLVLGQGTNGGATLTPKGTGVATIAGPTSITDATDASSSTTGSLKTAGGLGVAKKLYVGGNVYLGSNSWLVYDASNGLSFNTTNNDGTASQTSFYFQGQSSKRSRITLGVSGVTTLGIAGDTSANYYFTAENDTNTNAFIWKSNVSYASDFTSTGTTLLRLAYNTGNATFTGSISTSSTTDSSSTTTGALVVSGGVGIAKKLYVGTELTVSGTGISSFAGQTKFLRNNAGVIWVECTVAGGNTDIEYAVNGSKVGSLTYDSGASSFITYIGGSNKWQVNSSGNGVLGGSLTTAAPTSGTAKAWKLGEVASVSPTSPNRTIRVEIDGTVYYISAKTTND